LEFVEGYGLVVESVGRFPRMGGRVLAQLLLSEPPEQSQADLSQALRSSPGAISTTLRMLVDRGFVERISVTGDRKDYYRVSASAWERALEETLRIAANATRLIARGLELATQCGPNAEHKLRQMHTLVLMEEQSVRDLLDGWAEARRAVAPLSSTASTEPFEPPYPTRA
jgi:DNA-binding transcriptional regulator GbsR (MarR family)